MVRQAHHDHPEPVEGSPSPLPCGVSFTTLQGGPSPLRARGSSEPEAVKGEGKVLWPLTSATPILLSYPEGAVQ